MLDGGYFDGVNQFHYLTIYTLALCVILAACIWDVLQRRVPNWLWLAGLVLLPFSIAIREWDIGTAIREIVIVIAIALCCYALVRSGAWGMGDAKGITWISLIVGGLPAVCIVLLSYAFMPKKRENQPFFFYACSAMACVGGLAVLWTM